jgi:hypothetical protein
LIFMARSCRDSIRFSFASDQTAGVWLIRRRFIADMQTQKLSRVVETGMATSQGKMIGGRKIGPPMANADAKACAENWRKEGTECGLIACDEQGKPI